MGYAKVFDKILRSSIWGEDSDSRVAWIAMLVLADRDGFVAGAPSLLANMARVDESKFREALQRWQEPDPESCTSEFEGRRIKKVEGGFTILNHHKYRLMMGPEETKEYWARKKREQRQREGPSKPPKNKPLNGEIANENEMKRKAREEEG